MRYSDGQPSLFAPIHTSEQMPRETLLAWPPGDLFRYECGCILQVDGAMRRVIACTPSCNKVSCPSSRPSHPDPV
jgi:hypothetical protein